MTSFTELHIDKRTIPYVRHFVNQCHIVIAGTEHPYETSCLHIDCFPFAADLVTVNPETLDIAVAFLIPHTGSIRVYPLSRKDTP